MDKIDRFVSKNWNDQERINAVLEYLESCVGLPYIWGGQNKKQGGMDCSGLAQESLKVGAFYDSIDRTAQGMFHKMRDSYKYSAVECDISKFEDQLHALPLMVLFYGKSATKITHVAITVGKGQLIEAGGGGRRTTNEHKAIKQNAFVRRMGVWCRRDVVAVVDPLNRGVFYSVR